MENEMETGLVELRYTTSMEGTGDHDLGSCLGFYSISAQSAQIPAMRGV